MNIKRLAVSFAVSSLVLGTSLSGLSTIQAATKSTSSSILDHVYTDIIPGKNLLVYVFDSPDMSVTSQNVIDAFRNIGIEIKNTLPDTIVTGTEIITDARSYTVMVYGDVNADGRVNIFDAQMIALHDAFGGDKSLTDVKLEAGNVLNSDDSVNIFDAQRVALFDVIPNAKLLAIDLPLSSDLTAPVITLNGESDIILQVGSTYTDAGAKATDNRDQEKDLQGVIYQNGSVVNNVDTSKVGDYQIKYNTTDMAGNVATEVVRNVHIRKAVSILNYTNTDMTTKDIYSNTQDALLKTIKVDSNEMPYKLSDLKAYVTKNGQVIGSDKVEISFVKNGNNIDIYCNTKNEIGNISVIPYLGSSYDSSSSVQGDSIIIRVMNNVTSLNIKDTDKDKIKELVFLNGSNNVNVMSSDIFLNPTDTSLLKDGQIVIKTTGNITIEKKTVDESNNIVAATQPQSVIKYFEVKATDANMPEGTIEIYAVNHEDAKKIVTIEKASLKGIKLPYNTVNMNITDPEDVTKEKIQNREVVKKLVGSKVYLLIPIEFYQDTLLNSRFEAFTVGDVYIKTGGFAPDLVENKLTFTSNNQSLKLATKLFAVVNDELLDVTSNTSAPFDYVGFLFQTDVTNLEIKVSYGNITDTTNPGYVVPKTIYINKQ